MLGDVTSLPPLVSTPRMLPPQNSSENEDMLTDDGVTQIDQSSELIDNPSLE